MVPWTLELAAGYVDLRVLRDAVWWGSEFARMITLDMGTVFVSYLLVTIICTVVMGSLWYRIKGQMPGVGFWFADYVMQSVGFLLIVLRGLVPDLMSMLVSNFFILAGTVLLYMGLQRFVGKLTRQWHNVAMLAVYSVVQTYLIGTQGSLAARNILIAGCLIFITSQCAWLMIRGVEADLRRITRPVGLVMMGFAVLAVVRIIIDSSMPSPARLFDSPWTDTSVILANQLLFIGLTLSLILMVNRWLLFSLEKKIHSLELAEKSLRKSEAKFSAAFQTIPDAVLISVMSTGEILEVNESFYRTTGFTPDEVQGGTTLDIGLWRHPEDRHRFVLAMEANGRVDRTHVQFFKADGEPFSAELSSEILQVDEVTCALTVFRDVTEAEQAKQQLIERSEELLRSNRDLEQFAYVASHDLQEPLRMVINYTELMKRRYGEKLDEDADDFMNFALEGAHRMRTLITELLEYSRVQTTGQALASIDLEDAFAEAASNLTASIEESGATLTHDALPSTLCDRGQVVQVFQNLIGNALKFHRAEPPRIHVGAVRSDDIWTISVRDNGIGIDPEYFDQVFQIYRRLLARSEYPGSGMGLAISKRILERHGQRIWVESTPGEGSTFFFTLAAAPDQN